MTGHAVLKYIEKCTGTNHNGPAWIGRVRASKTGRTLYFNGKAFKRLTGGSIGNYYEVETGDEYWISGVKRDGADRHWAGSGPVTIARDVVQEYLTLVGADALDTARFHVAEIAPTDPAEFHARENAAND